MSGEQEQQQQQLNLETFELFCCENCENFGLKNCPKIDISENFDSNLKEDVDYGPDDDDDEDLGFHRFQISRK